MNAGAKQTVCEAAVPKRMGTTPGSVYWATLVSSAVAYFPPLLIDPELRKSLRPEDRAGRAASSVSVPCISMKQHLRNCAVYHDHQLTSQSVTILMAFSRKAIAEPFLNI
jgi:hypothetical protein